MLIEFQKALADLTASPALCRAVRQDPASLGHGSELYALSSEPAGPDRAQLT